MRRDRLTLRLGNAPPGNARSRTRHGHWPFSHSDRGKVAAQGQGLRPKADKGLLPVHPVNERQHFGDGAEQFGWDGHAGVEL